ncbi:MAG: EscU/YscU/HrcU family type III secretion system export apparatus switch protein [Anaerolineaceae bacterium]
MAGKPTNTTAKVKTAVALEFHPDKDEAPRVIAAGNGLIAERILEVARANDIPIREDEVLAQALSMVDLEQAIPQELYAVVAEVLAYVYRLKNKHVED